MKTLSILAVTLLMNCLTALKAQNSHGEIKGLIKDDEYNPVIGAVVKITQGGYLVGGTTTDENGKYVYKPLDPGNYELTVTSPMHVTAIKNKIPVKPSEATYVDIRMKINQLDQVDITAYVEDFVEPMVDATIIDITSIGAEEIAQSVNRNDGVMDMIANNSPGMVQDSEGEWHLHGGRADATEFLIDGVKVSSLNGLPVTALENVSLISGGVPAMYGDFTSGVVVVTTKDYFSGIRAKRVRNAALEEQYQLKQRRKRDKQEEENRAKEIEQEKLLELKNK